MAIICLKIVTDNHIKCKGCRKLVELAYEHCVLEHNNKLEHGIFG